MFYLGAVEDSVRIHDLILNNLDKIDSIIVTMDSHYHLHIAHSIAWEKGPKFPNHPINSPKAASVATSFFRNDSKITTAVFDRSQPKNEKKILEPIVPRTKSTNGVNHKSGGKYSMNCPVPGELSTAKQYVSQSKLTSDRQTITKTNDLVNHQKSDSKQYRAYDETKEELKASDRDARVESNGKSQTRHPKTFTVITHSDIENGIWIPVTNSQDSDKSNPTPSLEWCKHYTKELENQGNKSKTILSSLFCI